jgi:hypothetical protein
MTPEVVHYGRVQACSQGDLVRLGPCLNPGKARAPSICAGLANKTVPVGLGSWSYKPLHPDYICAGDDFGTIAAIRSHSSARAVIGAGGGY